MSASLVPRRIQTIRKPLERYRAVVGDEAVDELRELARELRGARVPELSATAHGGGVAELLSSLVPLQVDLDIDAQWHVMAGEPGFFEVTKKMHNGLQGMDVEIDDSERDLYLRHAEANARALEKGWDAVIVHDPQPAAIRSFLPAARGGWLWRCHIDCPEPHPPVWELLKPYVESHDEQAFTVADFKPPGLDGTAVTLVPAIDPLAAKNRVLPDYLARETAEELGVELSRPLLLQVSRFDPWKDPLGVVRLWRAVRERVPGLQLALVGAMAADDPEGRRLFAEVEVETRGEPGCLLLTDEVGVGHHEVNALQRMADVVVQKSLREGFGLIVSETLWKGTAMVAAPVGGIPVQLVDGETGYLASTDEEFAARVGELLEDPVRARELGAAGMRRVRERFLLPRLLRDHLIVLRRLVNGAAAPGPETIEAAEQGVRAEEVVQEASEPAITAG
jgi:trehalose synthase